MPLIFANTSQEMSDFNICSPASSAGALVTFAGRVRAMNEDRKVDHLFYEADQRLATLMFLALEEQARLRFSILSSHAVHRIGRVEVGDKAVIIAVDAGHRAEGFLGAQFLIDELKRLLPIFKKEVFADGNFLWGGCPR